MFSILVIYSKHFDNMSMTEKYRENMVDLILYKNFTVNFMRKHLTIKLNYLQKRGRRDRTVCQVLSMVKQRVILLVWGDGNLNEISISSRAIEIATPELIYTIQSFLRVYTHFRHLTTEMYLTI